LTRQLHLPIRLRDPASLENYFQGRNEEAFFALTQWLDRDTDDPVLFFYGVPGSGCSHLLQAACRFVSDNNEIGVYVPVGDPSIRREFIGQLNPDSTVCIDDLDRVAGDEHWEEAILEVYERLMLANGRLLFSALQPPLALGLKLPDLATRLTAGGVYRIQPLTEYELPQAMQLRARHRGLELPHEVIQYLLRRVSRNSTVIFDLLDCIDEASFANKRRLTVPFIREFEKEHEWFSHKTGVPK